ncbi:hypothetical protein RND81_08G210400 [Saponaria officinalis]|uniref:GDSL esterase/lipase n=1 Tax=Saponaria officinalis TaxID=3572 RepID=A0AAW1JA03_SAPOF
MITLLIFIVITTRASAANTSEPITAIYVFGDSTVDPGNNDYIPNALFRANHAPYGENFPNRVATGRFSDGLLATDFIANYLGLKELVPAYADPTVTDHDLLTGVSFASAGSGLDDLTIQISNAIGLRAQVLNFEQAIGRMERAAGINKTGWTVENAMFLISAGSNDLLINYFDLLIRELMFTPSSYSDFIIYRLQLIIESLYELGGRRFGVVGLAPLGCLPIQVSVASILPSSHWLQRVCVDQQNFDVQVYNERLQNLLNHLQSQYPDARFAYGDLYNPMMDMINNPHNYGLEVTLEGCCGTGILEAGELCNVIDPICANPSTYVFWDSIHPTQATHHVLANALETNMIPNLL